VLVINELAREVPCEWHQTSASLRRANPSVQRNLPFTIHPAAERLSAAGKRAQVQPALQRSYPQESNVMSQHELITATDAKPIKAWIRGVPLETEARAQLINAARMPFIHRHIAVMPDVHMGIGATVGSVIPTVGAIIPAAVGVDIGCGMCAVRTTLTANDLPESLRELRRNIEQAVPHGRTDNGGRNDRGAWHDVPVRAQNIWREHLGARYQDICEKHKRLDHGNGINHLGTLGTGNHFIEVCLDEDQRVWFMLHSGSRGVGNRFGQYFIELAKQDMRLRRSGILGTGLRPLQSPNHDGKRRRSRAKNRRNTAIYRLDRSGELPP
jgi:RNA-splicing ligase RtcB